MLSSGLQLSRIRGMASSSLTCREESTELRTQQPERRGPQGSVRFLALLISILSAIINPEIVNNRHVNKK